MYSWRSLAQRRKRENSDVARDEEVEKKKDRRGKEGSLLLTDLLYTKKDALSLQERERKKEREKRLLDRETERKRNRKIDR